MRCRSKKVSVSGKKMSGCWTKVAEDPESLQSRGMDSWATQREKFQLAGFSGDKEVGAKR